MLAAEDRGFIFLPRTSITRWLLLLALFLPRRQPFLRQDLDGTVDRDTHCAGISVEPSIGVQRRVFRFAHGTQLGGSVHLELRVAGLARHCDWRARWLTADISPRRVHLKDSHHRHDQADADRQHHAEERNAPWAKIFALVTRLGIVMARRLV